MAKKKGTFTKHTSRVGSRVGDRAKQFVTLARAGLYDQTQLAKDVSASFMDVAEFWGGVFGMRGSPTAPVAEVKATSNSWKSAAGASATVVLEDPVPDDAVFPAGGGAPLKLTQPDGSGATKLELQTVTIQEEENLQLLVNFRDTTGGGSVAVGEYYAILSYTSVSLGAGSYFACLVRGIVMP